MPISAARASASSGRGLPSRLSARAISFSIAASSSARKTSTRARDSSAALSSNDGFSVVAPISVTEPSSMTGRNESCWARLKRWISSTNSSVAPPVARRARAASKIFFSSATPEWIAETCTNSAVRLAPISRATVVLPVPGGPQKIIEPSVGGFEHPRQRALGPGQMLLAGDFGEAFRPQPLGERRGRRQDAADVGRAVHGSLLSRRPHQVQSAPASALLSALSLEHCARVSNDARSAR